MKIVVVWWMGHDRDTWGKDDIVIVGWNRENDDIMGNGIAVAE